MIICGIFGTARYIAKKSDESPVIDNNNIYLKNKTKITINTNISAYERKIKPAIDRALSFMALIVLMPFFIVISLAIYIDDPGTIFFTQTRVGKGKRFFKIHKFRTMKMNTPHDIPTHQLSNPEQYITKVGKFLRESSLDELPQIWDIFRGKMSIIGPRPALWNQEDLIEEREKWDANSCMPGLTGLAQIKGRDELEIIDKARIDGEYIGVLRSGNWKGFLQDVRCFVKTIISVINHDGVLEGGTGEMGKRRLGICSAETYRDAGFKEYGYLKKYCIDKSSLNRKKVLITGINSYIGESFEVYAKAHYPENLEIETTDMTDDSWREKDFSKYDAIFHVAGIAHADVGHVKDEVKRRYYKVNTGLALETAQKAKREGVKQFVFMSSMIVYGDSVSCKNQKIIDEYTLPNPEDFYGDSKWQADKRLRRMGSDDFHVAVIRAPMIYGKGSKGNYLTLSKLAKILPMFPDVKNRRSMLYIDNLCEFLSLLILSGENGIYFPQNAEYCRTSTLVEEIRKSKKGTIHLVKVLNFAVVAGSRMPGKISRLINKAFGNNVYSQKLSIYNGLDYRVVDFEESIRRTEEESKEKNTGGKPILFLVNHDVVIYNFRLELVERLLEEGYEVHISSPYGQRIDDLVALGAKYHKIVIDRHGMNPVADLAIIKEYKRLIDAINPIMVLGYTIKPNIYGAFAAKAARVPFIPNITGLGTAVENGGFCQKLIILFYKAAFTHVKTVFFQNKANMRFFRRYHIAVGKYKLIPGSGVNLKRFPLKSYPYCQDGKEGEPVRFAFISRIMKEKGIEQYLVAARQIKVVYPQTEFHICGFCEEEYEGKLEELNSKGIIKYHGMIQDVAEFMADIHCVVHPTYYPEGISNVLLEACSCGRPIITTDHDGCREVVEDGVNGYMIPQRNSEALVNAIERFLKLSWKEKESMGLAGRRIVETQFDRMQVVEAYMKEINYD